MTCNDAELRPERNSPRPCCSTSTAPCSTARPTCSPRSTRCARERGEPAMVLDELAPACVERRAGDARRRDSRRSTPPSARPGFRRSCGTTSASWAGTDGRSTGVEPMLAQLEAAGCVWGIVTNKPEYLAVQLMPLLGWQARCAVLIGGDTLPVRKPDPLPLIVAAERIGVAAAECVYVGDDERDIVAARAAGMPSVVALWGYRLSEDDPVAWQGDVLVDDAGRAVHRRPRGRRRDERSRRPSPCAATDPDALRKLRRQMARALAGMVGGRGVRAAAAARHRAGVGVAAAGTHRRGLGWQRCAPRRGQAGLVAGGVAGLGAGSRAAIRWGSRCSASRRRGPPWHAALPALRDSRERPLRCVRGVLHAAAAGRPPSAKSSRRLFAGGARRCGDRAAGQRDLAAGAGWPATVRPPCR